MVSSFREVPKETAPAKPALPVQAPVDTGIDYRTIAIAAGAGILLFLLILFLSFWPQTQETDEGGPGAVCSL